MSLPRHRAVADSHGGAAPAIAATEPASRSTGRTQRETMTAIRSRNCRGLADRRRLALVRLRTERRKRANSAVASEASDCAEPAIDWSGDGGELHKAATHYLSVLESLETVVDLV